MDTSGNGNGQNSGLGSLYCTNNVLYSGKVWQVKGLENLTNCLQFAKLKAFKVIVTINNPLADLLICHFFSPNA